MAAAPSAGWPLAIALLLLVLVGVVAATAGALPITDAVAATVICLRLGRRRLIGVVTPRLPGPAFQPLRKLAGERSGGGSGGRTTGVASGGISEVRIGACVPKCPPGGRRKCWKVGARSTTTLPG